MLFVSLSHAAVCNNECNVTLTFPVACPVNSKTLAAGSVSIKQCQCDPGFELSAGQCMQSTASSASAATVGLIVGGAIMGLGVAGFAFWSATSSYVKPIFPLSGVKINP